MPPRGLTLRFSGQPNATRTAIADLTAQELKRRGWNIETLEGEHFSSNGAIHNETTALLARRPTAPQTPEDSVEAFVEVELGISNDESRTSEQLNFTKIVLKPDIEPAQGVAEILSKLESLGWVAGSSTQESLYDEDDEAMIRSRLEALGYL